MTLLFHKVDLPRDPLEPYPPDRSGRKRTATQRNPPSATDSRARNQRYDRVISVRFTDIENIAEKPAHPLHLGKWSLKTCETPKLHFSFFEPDFPQDNACFLVKGISQRTESWDGSPYMELSGVNATCG